MEVKLRTDNKNQTNHINMRLETTEANSITANCQEVNDISQFLQQFDLSMLDSEQQQLVKAMLVEESETFSRNDDDIGCAKDKGVLLTIPLRYLHINGCFPTGA